MSFERVKRFGADEYAILFALLRDQITDREYRRERWWAYVRHGYTPPWGRP